MKRIKQILIGVFISILLIPIFTNNVYAKTEYLYWDNVEQDTYKSIGNGTWSGTHYINDVDLGNILSASIKISYSHTRFPDEGWSHSTYVIFSVCKDDGTEVFSKKSSGPEITVNLSDVTGMGYFKIYAKSQQFPNGCADETNYSKLTIKTSDNPRISSITANGNSCVQSNGNLTT